MKNAIVFIFFVLSTPVFALGYRVVTPKHIRPNPTLITLLHGCSQSGQAFLNLTHFKKYVEEKNFIILMPEQSWLRNPGKCWNWFLPENSLGRSEYNGIVSLVRKYGQKYQVERSYLYGFSAGAAMGSNLIAKNSELFDGVLLHSGYPYHGGGVMNFADFDLHQSKMSFLDFWQSLSGPILDDLTVLRNKTGKFHPRLKDIIIVSGERDSFALSKFSKASYVQFLDKKASLTKEFHADYSIYQGKGQWRTTLYQFHQLGHAWSGGIGHFFAAPDFLDITSESFSIFAL